MTCDEALNGIDFFLNTQPDLAQIKLGVLRTKLSKIELVLNLMRLVRTKLLEQGFIKCLATLQRVSKRSYWALNKHIKTAILDKAFKASDKNNAFADDDSE